MDNQNRILFKTFLPGIVLLFFLIVYLALPSGFSTTDAWNYAAEIKFKGDLFYPYHLLYNLLGYLFSYFPAKADLDVLGSLKIMNSIFAVLSLWSVQKILRSLHFSTRMVALVSFLAGASFSVMRYATENETYIVPLFTGLTALFYYLKFLDSDRSRYVVMAALFSSLSVLFHMIYIFWWSGLFLGFISGIRRRQVFRFLAVSMIIPAAYLVVVSVVTKGISPENFKGFILDDFRNNAHLGISPDGLFLSAASLVRSFVQVHGYLVNMIKMNLLFIIPGIISLNFFIMSLFHLPRIVRKPQNNQFIRVILYIIILQFIFAVLSYGNAEFMVMIPVLIFILAVLVFKEYERFLVMLGSGIIVWNLFYGLIPLKLNSPSAADFLVNESLKNENTVIIASDDQLIISMVHYKTGIKGVNNIYKSPAILNINKRDTGELEKVISMALSKGEDVFTDCTGNNPLSRAVYIEGDINSKFFSSYQTEVVFTGQSITGQKIISSIKGRKETVPY